jgi:hypothetical protein
MYAIPEAWTCMGAQPSRLHFQAGALGAAWRLPYCVTDHDDAAAAILQWLGFV